MSLLEVIINTFIKIFIVSEANIRFGRHSSHAHASLFRGVCINGEGYIRGLKAPLE
jgi:hypothetical protein